MIVVTDYPNEVGLNFLERAYFVGGINDKGNYDIFKNRASGKVGEIDNSLDFYIEVERNVKEFNNDHVST